MTYLLTNKDLKNTSAVLRVKGPDANTYLQGQFTQDLRLAEKGPIYGLWLDQKGKVVADSCIIRMAVSDFLVVGFAGPAALLLARLEAYLIADEVELHDVTGEWAGLLIWGDSLPDLSLPAGAQIFPSRRAGPQAREILVPVAQADEVLAQVRKCATEGTRDAAELARLRAALPAVPADIGPRDLPAEGALDGVAISFTKGCYLGQEVIARLKNLGQVRRALHLVSGAGAPPASGTALHQGDRKIGEVRSSAAEGDGFLAMAMLSLVNLDAAAPLGVAAGGDGIRILRRV
ncbi:MAG: YgfZ/GcvT domain-containing protein [Verrucomicrobiota bacterium]